MVDGKGQVFGTLKDNFVPNANNISTQIEDRGTDNFNITSTTRIYKIRSQKIAKPSQSRFIFRLFHQIVSEAPAATNGVSENIKKKKKKPKSINTRSSSSWLSNPQRSHFSSSANTPGIRRNSDIQAKFLPAENKSYLIFEIKLPQFPQYTAFVVTILRPLLVCRCFFLAATSHGGGWSDSSESILTGWASGDGEERRVWCLEKARSMPARWSSAMAKFANMYTIIQ
ncbi:kinesin light chain [Striga asiatica]|uniref:Kinesin light chain n=1 Tax=Striga asiatica TaxID=4170 RepID=A0A5A7R068_STRAF|nr:kinesin light chain [Striga asiatica]